MTMRSTWAYECFFENYLFMNINFVIFKVIPIRHYTLNISFFPILEALKNHFL